MGSKVNSFAPIKRDLVARLDLRRAAARAFIETLSPDLPVHDSSDWTARDLIIHLTALEADMVRAIHDALDGEHFSVDMRGQPSVTALYELRRRDWTNHSWRELLAEWEQVRDHLRGVVLAFPADKMEMRFSTPFFQECNLTDAVQACRAHEGRHLAEMRAAASRQDS